MTAQPTRKAARDELFDLVPDPVFVLDGQGVFLDLNSAAARYLGGSPETLKGRSVTEIFEAEQAQRQLEVIREVFRTGEPFAEERVTAIGEETFIFRYALRRLQDRSGRPLGILGMVRDVTGQVDLERRYAELYEKATDALFAVDREGRVRTLNRQAELLSGYSRDVVESLHFSQVVAKEEVGRMGQYFRDRVEGRDAPTRYEVRYIHASGEERWAEVHIAREESSVGAFQASVRDISHRKRLEALRHDVLQMISHDVKTPLTVIQGFASALAGGMYGRVSPEQQTGLQSILQASRRIRHLMEQFLLAEQLDSDEARHPRKCAALAVVREVVESVRGEADAKGVHLELAAEGVGGHLVEDQEGVRCIAENLLSNALKFTAAGGKVAVRVCPEESGLRLEVDDTGVGIPESELEKVFERFYRGSTSTGTWGTGLGLYIVRKMTERMGGRVAAASCPGEGTRFQVWMPVIATE